MRSWFPASEGRAWQGLQGECWVRSAACQPSGVPVCDSDSESQGPAVCPDSLLSSRPLKDEESHVTQHAERGWSKGCQDAGEGPVME